MRLKVGILLFAGALLTRYDWQRQGSSYYDWQRNGSSSSLTPVSVPPDHCGQRRMDLLAFNTSFVSLTATTKSVQPCSNDSLPPANVEEEQQVPEANNVYPKPMSWEWFWSSLTEDQKNSHDNLSQEEKDALWDQKRIQFQYSSKNIPNSPNDHIPGDDGIPQIFHFIYISPGLPLDQPVIPPNIIQTVDKWQELHPEYMVVLWRNTDIISNFPDILPTIRSLPVMAWIADILRYHVLEKYGGIYLDTDMSPLQSIEPLRNRFSPFFVNCQWGRKRATLEYFVRSDKHYLAIEGCWMNNSVIGSKPNNPVLKAAIARAMSNTHKTMATFKAGKTKLDIPNLAGPVMFGKIASRYKVNLLRHTLFEPCGFGRLKCPLDEALRDPQLAPHIYATHQFKKSWHTTEVDPNIIPYDASLAAAAAETDNNKPDGK